MFVQALFLYIEKRIIRIIGNPVMDDNCKMVAKFRAITLWAVPTFGESVNLPVAYLQNVKVLLTAMLLTFWTKRPAQDLAHSRNQNGAKNAEGKSNAQLSK